MIKYLDNQHPIKISHKIKMIVEKRLKYNY
jgi:hypothetical protein